jgi:hypothetical protein
MVSNEEHEVADKHMKDGVTKERKGSQARPGRKRKSSVQHGAKFQIDVLESDDEANSEQIRQQAVDRITVTVSAGQAAYLH